MVHDNSRYTCMLLFSSYALTTPLNHTLVPFGNVILVITLCIYVYYACTFIVVDTGLGMSIEEMGIRELKYMHIHVYMYV